VNPQVNLLDSPVVNLPVSHLVNRLVNLLESRLVSQLVNLLVSHLANLPVSRLVNLLANLPVNLLVSLLESRLDNLLANLLLNLLGSQRASQLVPLRMSTNTTFRKRGMLSDTAAQEFARMNAQDMGLVTRITTADVLLALMVKLITWALIARNVCAQRILHGLVTLQEATICTHGQSVPTKVNAIVELENASVLKVTKVLHVPALCARMTAMTVEHAGQSVT